MARSRFLARLLALALGMGAALLLAEGGLRAAGLCFRLAQRSANQARGSGAATRVVCLGESTTALGGRQAYPAQLETLLAERAGPGRYVVLNAAIPGADSRQVVDRVELDLDLLQPDFLVAMIGANDAAQPMQDPLHSLRRPAVWDALRLTRLARMVAWLIRHPERGATVASAADLDEHGYQARLVADSSYPPALTRFAWAQIERGQAAEALATLRASWEDLPGSPPTAFMIGYCHERLGQADEAGRWYQQALEASRRGPSGGPLGGGAPPGDLADLATFLREHTSGDLLLADTAARVAVARLPDEPRAWMSLASAAQLMGDTTRAEEAWEHAARLAPGDPAPRVGLARLHGQRDAARAEAELLALREGSAGDPDVMLALAELLLAQGRREEAADAARAALAGGGGIAAELVLVRIEEAAGQPGMAFRRLFAAAEATDDCEDIERAVRHLTAQGRHGEAADLVGRRQRAALPAGCADRLRRAATCIAYEGAVLPATAESYARLHAMAARTGAVLVAVQYPTLPAAPLRDALRAYPDVPVVDNEAPFLEVARREGHAVLFTDLGYGTFGHGTTRGNRLLAERVADAVLPRQSADQYP